MESALINQQQEYKENPFRTNAWIEQLSYSSISPGITSYVDNPAAGADAILQQANSVITNEVPKDSQKDTRVFLGAVAGVRLLE
ncbi:unnamed protein product [Hymenolepis diminuta]|uniref:Uncharacterized protein n=1 Tax=Hymenolepis diminuta TaxID=6216 RepID=A0A0R3SMU1_HYMDI|nr:unnamed protein product [Hymenolepis diminuta]